MVDNLEDTTKGHFLFPIHPYHGSDSFVDYLFNAKLQKFSTQVSYIASLHGNGKLTSQEVCQKLGQLWKILES